MNFLINLIDFCSNDMINLYFKLFFEDMNLVPTLFCEQIENN